MRRYLPVLLTLGLLAGLSWASSASAHTVYCVPTGAPGCTPESTLNDAIAATSGDRDTITLAHGTFPTDATTFNATNVDIVGSGRGNTTISRTDATSGLATIALSNASLSALTVTVPTASSTVGVAFLGDGNALNDVTVTQSATAVGTIGVLGNTDGTITNSTISHAGHCIRTDGAADVSVDQVALTSCGSEALDVKSGGTTRLDHAQITGCSSVGAHVEAASSGSTIVDHTTMSGCGFDAFEMDGTGALEIQRSILSQPSRVAFIKDGTTRVDSSLVTCSCLGFDIQPLSAAQAPVVTINQSTLIGVSPSGEGISVSPNAGTSATLNVFDTIIQGFVPHSIEVGGVSGHPGNMLVDHTSFDNPPTADSSGAAGNKHTTNSFPAAQFPAGFVNPVGGNFQLGSGSALVDRDPTGLRLPGELLTTDLLGFNRFVGARDIGAYEVQPPAQNNGGGGSVAPAITGSLKFSPKKVKHGKKGKVSYSLSAPATVTFTAKGKKSKKNKKPKTIKLGSQSGKAGSNSFTFKTSKLKAGKYTFSATPAGGTPKTASLTVKK